MNDMRMDDLESRERTIIETLPETAGHPSSDRKSGAEESPAGRSTYVSPSLIVSQNSNGHEKHDEED